MPGEKKKISISQMFQLAFLTFRNLRHLMNKNKVGFPVFDYDDIFQKLETFVLHWQAHGKPKLYFVTMDIEKCYDSILPGALRKILLNSVFFKRRYSFILYIYIYI